MKIDVHGHITSPELFERFPMPPSLADIDGMIESKLRHGIDLTVVGSPVGAGTMVPVDGLDNYDQPVDGLQRFHTWVAEQVRLRPAHLRAYVYVNPFATDGTLELAAQWLDEPEFVGIIANTSVRGRFLDDPAAEGLFALAAERKVPVLLHPPAEPVGADALRGEPGVVEHVLRPCDITAGVAAVLAGGWFDRFPDLTLIAPNAGGALSLLAEKLALADRRAAGGPPPGVGGPPPGVGGPPPGVGARPGPRRSPMAETLRRVHVDTATPSRRALAAAAEVFGPGRLLFGTDSPPLATSLSDALAMVDGLGLSAPDHEAVCGGTAARLFGLVPAVTS